MYEKDQPTTLLLAQCMGRRVWMRVFVFHFYASQTHFHKKSLARGLVLKQRQKATRKWPIFKRVPFCRGGGGDEHT